MKPFGYFIFFLSLAGAASAQTQTLVIKGGKIINSGASQASAEQQLMLKAPDYIYNKDYRGAENLYSQVIQMNPNNISAYIQRGLVRRELGDREGVAADGRMAVTLANEAIKANPNYAYFYYERGAGFRLLKQFEQAKTDIAYAMRLGGDSTWDLDLKAIALEEKMAQSAQ